MNDSINQSIKHIYIAPCVTSNDQQSDTHNDAQQSIQ